MVGGMASYEGPTVGTNWAAVEHQKRMDGLGAPCLQELKGPPQDKA